jgi:23S rRNA (adenine2503-C2)-methyltransferase
MKLLADYTTDELNAILNGAPAYRAKQLFKWVSLGAGYDEMSDLPKSMREGLRHEYGDTAAQIIKEVPAPDGSVKLLYGLWDANAVEGIYMPHSYGNTLCVSTQVGCRMRCAFCASGLDGLVRNLSAGEIYGQVIAANKRFSGAGERALSNVVLMGSGEPLDNYDAVTKAVRLFCDEGGLNLSQRGVSLSTCGLPDGIRRLADAGFSVTLSISLHATTDEVRQQLMPIAKKYTIHQVLDAARYYFEKTGRRVAIEYVMIKDQNISFFDAKRLKELLKGMSAHINLIPLNYVKESALTPAGAPAEGRFLSRLKELGLSASIRKSAGSGTDGACGQLRAKYVKTNAPTFGGKKD